MGPAAPHGGHRRLPEPAPAPPPLPRPPPPSPLKNPGTCVSSHLTIAPPLVARPGTRELAAAGLAPPRPSLACVVDPARQRPRAARPSVQDLVWSRKEKEESRLKLGRRLMGLEHRARAHEGEHARALRTVPGQPPLLSGSHAPPPQAPPFPSPWGHVRCRCPRPAPGTRALSCRNPERSHALCACASRACCHPPLPPREGVFFFSLLFRVKRETPAPFVANIFSSARGTKSGS